MCLAWNWEHDADFVSFFQGACEMRNLSLLQITPSNVESLLGSLQKGEFTFQALFDRASDEDDRFLPVVEWSRQHDVYRLNPFLVARWSWNKAAMHHEFTVAGLQLPETIILPSFQLEPELPPANLGPLGDCFAIKPAHGGGGKGVVTEANSLDQIQAARQGFPHDQYLLQEHIVAERLDSREAWFRVIYCAGHIYPFWWGTTTHAYNLVSTQDRQGYSLGPLWTIARVIAEICKLDLFSTEIALTPAGDYVVVDYINDPIDLRLKSRTPQGIPDHIVEAIAHRLAAEVNANLNQRFGFSH